MRGGGSAQILNPEEFEPEPGYHLDPEAAV